MFISEREIKESLSQCREFIERSAVDSCCGHDDELPKRSGSKTFLNL